MSLSTAVIIIIIVTGTFLFLLGAFIFRKEPCQGTLLCIFGLMLTLGIIGMSRVP